MTVHFFEARVGVGSCYTSGVGWSVCIVRSPLLQEKSAVLQAELQPLMELARHNRIHQNGEEYVKTRYKLYVTYLLNISFYMALKMKKIPVHNHPVVKRLAEYRTVRAVDLKMVNAC